MSSSFQVGDLVWAKMKGFSTWPGRVSIPIPSLGLKSPRNMSQLQCVYFFGSNNYGWVKEKNMKPYQEFKEKMMMYCNTSAFKAAISDIDSYIENPESFGVIDGPVQNGVEENEALKDAESEQSEEINLPNNASESFGVIDAPVQYGVEENGVLKENAVNGEIEQKRLSEETNLPNNSSEIRDVILRLHKIRYYKCDECPRMYISQDKLDEHKKIHVHIFSSYVLLDRAEVLRYKCRTCRRGFQQLRECRLHELIHVQEDIHKRKYALNDDNGNIVKPYECEDCGVRFALSSTLSAHSILHKPFPYLCDCGIGFFREMDFEAHRQTVHPNVRKWIPKTNYKGPKPKLEFVVKKRARQPSPVTDSLDESIDSPDEIKVKPVDRAWRSKVKKNKSDRKRGTRKITKMNPTENKSIIKLKNEYGEEIDILKNEIGRFACPRCDKHFRSRHNVVTHFRVHTGEKPFACEHCDKRFSLKSIYDSHLSVHGLGKRSYVCDYCDAGYSHKTRLELHITNQHLGYNYRPYVCKVCKKRFGHQLLLNRHLKTHEGIRNFICKYCKKGFLLAASLILHERTHTGEKPYVCTYCEKSFSDPSAFQRHIRTHTGDKRYACKLCTMRFSDASGLIAHKKRHIGDSERSKECDICKKKFYTNSELKNHVIAVHAFIRKYECSECDKKCSSKANLQGHILRMHGVMFCDKCRRSFSTDKALQKHIAKDCPKRKKKKKVRKEIKEESFEVPVSYSTKMEM